MGLDVWFREDVARALQAARGAGRQAQAALERVEYPAGNAMYPGGTKPFQSRANPAGSGPPWQGRPAGGEMDAYWRGYEAALATIGIAFGLGEPSAHGPTLYPVTELGEEQASSTRLLSPVRLVPTHENSNAHGERE